MNARQEITRAAAERGWTLVSDGSYDQRFERTVPHDPTHRIEGMKAAGGVSYPARQGVVVAYTTSGSVHSAFWQTPGDQQVLTGKLVGSTEEALGPHKRERVLAWLARQEAYPEL